MDTFKHQGLRRQLVRQLEEKGITDERVLQAINRIPRHSFMDNAFLAFAYEDKAFPIAAGQTISQPYTVAFQSSLLQIEKGQKVLEIGTGSGYQTAVLLELGAKVFSIERHKVLFDKTKKLLTKMGYSPKLFYGDGYKGLPAFAPFDKIIVTAGAPEIPKALVDQLAPKGRMVIPVGSGEGQVMILLKKDSEGVISKEEHGLFAFVPMLKNRESQTK